MDLIHTYDIKHLLYQLLFKICISIDENYDTESERKRERGRERKRERGAQVTKVNTSITIYREILWRTTNRSTSTPLFPFAGYSLILYTFIMCRQNTCMLVPHSVYSKGTVRLRWYRLYQNTRCKSNDFWNAMRTMNLICLLYMVLNMTI